MHKAEPYATGHNAELIGCEWVSAEKTKNMGPEGGGFTR